MSAVPLSPDVHTFGGRGALYKNETHNQSPRSNNSQGTVHNTQASISMVNGEITARVIDRTQQEQPIHERAISVNYRRGSAGGYTAAVYDIPSAYSRGKNASSLL